MIALKTLPLIGAAWPALKIGFSIGLTHWHARVLEHRIRRSPEWRQLQIEARRHQELWFGDPHDACKFLSLDFWLRENIHRALRVKLHRREPSAVLDLGCGSGLFPFVCRFFGHTAVGLDKPINYCRPDEAIVYSLMTNTLQVSVNRSMIEAFTPMEVVDTYDVITAFMICFNDHQQSTEWGRSEWIYFLADAASHLRPKGSLYLALNPHHERYGSLKYFDQNILDLLTSCGTVDRREGTVTIVREQLLQVINAHSASPVRTIAHARPNAVEAAGFGI